MHHEDVQEKDVRDAQEEGSMIEFDLRVLTQFREEGPYVQVLSDLGTARLVLFAFKAGQQLKEHKTSSQIVVQVLRGRVSFSTATSSVKLQAGKLVQLEAGVPHSVTAQTDAVMLLTLTPSPSYHSLGLHQGDAQRLVPLVTRAKPV